MTYRRLLLYCFLICPLLLRANIHDSDDLRIEIDSLFQDNSTALGAYHPVEITIDNRSNRNGRWQMYAFSSAWAHRELTFRTELQVPAKTKTTFRHLLPMATHERSWMSTDITISGTHLTVPFQSHVTSGNPDSVSGLLSQSLTHDYGSRLRNAFTQSNRKDLHLGSLRKGDAPTDWRAYLGLRFVMLRHTDWNALSATARDALTAWVVAGGELRLLNAQNVPLAGLSGEPYTELGLGRVLVYADTHDELIAALSKAVPVENGHSRRNRDGNRHTLFDTSTQSFLNYRDRSLISNANDSKSEMLRGLIPLEFESLLDMPSVNVVIIAVSVIAFGVLIGPVNFFLFAKGRRRWRLFLSIPALSLAFTVLVVMSIIISEGFGGTGKRASFVILDPDVNRKFVLQHEVARTNILMSSAFEVPQLADYQTLLVNDRSMIDGYHHAGKFHYEGLQRLSGAYFQSRRLQWNQLRTFEPTRERVIVEASDGKWFLRPSLQAVCEIIFYIDEQGDFWMAEGMGVGARTELKPASPQQFVTWWRQQLMQFPELMTPSLQEVVLRRGWFYASANLLPTSAITTHTSIQWQDHHTLIVGPVSTRANTTAGTEPANNPL